MRGTGLLRQPRFLCSLTLFLLKTRRMRLHILRRGGEAAGQEAGKNIYAFILPEFLLFLKACFFRAKMYNRIRHFPTLKQE